MSSYMLDILGSMAIGALVILMVFRFNQTMLSASNEKLLYNITQLNTVSASEVIEYDFYKIGFRVDTADVFSIAELSRLEYLSDVDNNGVIDTILYSMSDSTALYATVNPHDKLLYRTVNGGNPQIVTSVVDFELSYRDSIGGLITPISDLSVAAKRREIRGIDVYINMQSADIINGFYQGTEWKRALTLKNIY
jgi:hypothetical protein